MMTPKSLLMSGLLAVLLIVAPGVYLYTVVYPQYADNMLYVVGGGLLFVAFAGMAAGFVSKRGGK